MKFEKQIEDFILMRIEGKSFDDIAAALNTTKQTLIDWNKKVNVREQITEGKTFKINGIVKTYQFDIKTRLQNYLQLSQRINKELAQRDLKEISTDLLLKMSITNDNRIKELLDKKIQIGTNENIIDFENGDGFFHLQLDE